jgi:hypothetical protein
MLHIDATFEDARLIITRSAAIPTSSSSWVGTISDNMTGKEYVVQWSDIEVSAVLALATGMGEDDPESDLTMKLYEIAEPLFNNLASELRLIP